MKTKRTFLYCLYGLIFVFASNCIFPVYGQQPRPGMLKPEEALPSSRSTSFLSNDWVYWESQKPVEYYVIDQTPLKTLPGYDTLYPQSVSSTLPTEKGYAVTWEIVDSQLYLCNIDFYTLRGWGSSGSLEIENEELKAAYEKMEDEYYPDGKKYRIMEQFTGEKFQKDRVNTAWPPKPQGVMPAVWVNGTFLLKQNIDKKTIPVNSESDPSNLGTPEEYTRAFENAPTFKVTFSKGRIVSVDRL